jgi:hypothetical protein
MFDSVVSILAQSKPNPQHPKTSKMSVFLDQVEDLMRQSKADNLIKSKNPPQKLQTKQNH